MVCWKGVTKIFKTVESVEVPRTGTNGWNHDLITHEVKQAS